MYKLYTSVLNERILLHVEPVWREVYEQRGAKRDVAGCRDLLLADRCITQDAIRYKRNLSMCWIDFQKAYDFTSHEVVCEVLRWLNVHHNIRVTLRDLMSKWHTKFHINTRGKTVISDAVQLKRGILQGDSLSPILFCITLLPLTVRLRQHDGYKAGPPNRRVNEVTHALYMDDLKIYANSPRGLKASIDEVVEYSNHIGMKLGLAKCAAIHITRGKPQEQVKEGIELIDGGLLKYLSPDLHYKYLGLQESHTVDAKLVKMQSKQKYIDKLEKIWESELSAVNKVNATNTLALPLLMYTFGVVRWTRAELARLDEATRKIMAKHRCHHPHASVQRIYMSRARGGRGLLGVTAMHDRSVILSALNIATSNDKLHKIIQMHEGGGNNAFLYKAAADIFDEMNLKVELRNPRNISISPAELKKQRKAYEQSQLESAHLQKPLHGKYLKLLGEPGYSKKRSLRFLLAAGLRAETEGFIIAAQDGVISTLSYQKRIIGLDLHNTLCRKCGEKEETVAHLLSACSKYAKTEYIYRHDAALRVLYFFLRHHYGLDDSPVIPYVPESIETVATNKNCKIYWNFSFATTTQIQANKPDLVLLDIKDRRMYIVEFAAPLDENLLKKEKEKHEKYADLRNSLRTTYPDYDITMVVLVVGAMGAISENFITNLRKIPACKNAEHLLNQMQKAVILGSLRLLRKHQAT